MIMGMNYSGMHDSAVAVIDDAGTIRYAASEERFSRIKKESRFPQHCLGQVDLQHVTHIAVPYLAEAVTPTEADPFFADVLLKQQTPVPLESYPPIWRTRLESCGKPLVFVDHQLAHAAAGYTLSGYGRALVVTSDYGAYHCPWNMGIYCAEGDKITLLHGASHSHYHPQCSLYSIVTALLGFRPNVHEGKVTGLAAYGDDDLACEAALWQVYTEICSSPIPLYEWVGWLDETICASLETNTALAAHYRSRLASYSNAQLARAVQRLTEQQTLTLLRRALTEWPCDSVVLSGGLFANVKVNLEVKRLGLQQVFVCPPMGDEGLAVGAALLARSMLGLGSLRGEPVQHLFWGGNPADNTLAALNDLGIVFDQPDDVVEQVAALLAVGKTVVRVTGGMEFGPRALGHRSILYQATDPTVNDWLNKKLHRTEFMPFAPIVRAERAVDLFNGDELAGAEHSAAFMTICFHCNEWFREACPAVVHVDGTARPQLVYADVQPDLHAILAAYERITGLPALINTSFNVHDEPIVASVKDAIVAFFQSDLDYLLLDTCLVSRQNNVVWTKAASALSGPALREQKALHVATKTTFGRRVLDQYSEQQRLASLYEQQQHWIVELEHGKAWLEEQRINFQNEFTHLTGLIEELRAEVERQRVWTVELEQGKAWLEAQSSSLQSEISRLTTAFQEQQDWTSTLEHDKKWFEEQHANLQQEVKRLTAIIDEQRSWIGELEQGKAWLETQHANWQTEAERRAIQIDELHAWIAELERPKSLREYVQSRIKTKERKQLS